MSEKLSGSILNIDKLSETVKNVWYPIRGRVHLRALELKKELNRVFI